MSDPSSATLTLQTLHLLSEELCLEFQRQVTQASVDCRDHPLNKKARKVSVDLDFFPDPSDHDNVIIRPSAGHKLPRVEVASVTSRRTNKTNQLVFDFSQEEDAK